MKRLWVLALLLLVVAALPAAAGESQKNSGALAFEKMKGLVGRWEGANRQGQNVVAIYELVSGGTALLERYLDPNPQHSNMITMYHPDGARLVLTHYCAANNQPRMRAEAYDPASRTLAFEFLDATNLPSPNAGHMRRVVFRFVDDGHFTSEWTFYQDGKAAFTETVNYRRVKESAPARWAPPTSAR